MARFYFRCSSFFWLASQNSYQKYHVCVHCVNKWFWLLLFVDGAQLATSQLAQYKNNIIIPMLNVCSIPVLMHHYQQSCCFSVVSFGLVFGLPKINDDGDEPNSFFLLFSMCVLVSLYARIFSMCVCAIYSNTHTQQKNSKNETNHKTKRLKLVDREPTINQFYILSLSLSLSLGM